MRIVCQKCSSAYAIDDKLISPKGVRAQCPRCRHLQLVKRDDAPSAESGGMDLSAKTAPAPPSAPSAPPPRAVQPPPPVAATNPFDFSAPAAPPAAPPFPGASSPGTSPRPAAGANPFDFAAPQAPNPFDFSKPITSPKLPNPFDFSQPPPPTSRPAAAVSPFDFSKPATGGGANPFDFGAPPPNSPASQAPAFTFDAPPPPPSAPKPAAGGGFGFSVAAAPPPPPAPRAAPEPRPSVLTDLDFDPTPASAPPPRPSRPESADPSVVKCRTCGKAMTDPFDQALGVCDDCRNKSAEASVTESPFPSIELTTDPGTPVAKLGSATSGSHPSVGAEPKSGVRSAMRDGAPTSRRGPVIGAVVALVVLGAVGGFLALKRPWVTKAPPLVVRNATTASGKPVDAIIQQWRLKYPDLEGTSASKLIEDGENALARDTTSGYRDAEEAFEQALVLDPDSTRALAGWVQSLAFGRGGRIDEPTVRAAQSMLAEAEKGGSALAVFVAHAHFLIAIDGNPNDIRVLAERGQGSDDARIKALAALAVGTTLLSKNPVQAAEQFKGALLTDPSLKRAYFFQARLAATQGNYKAATQALEQRLTLDPDQAEAAEELARLLVDVGEIDKARKTLDRAKAADATAARPRISRAMLRYQHQGELSEAAAELVTVIDDKEATRAEHADALLHLGTIQRVQGDVDAASGSIRRALELQPESLPAKLQQFLISVDKNVMSTARLELESIKGKLKDRQLERTLEGRLLLGENRLDEAFSILSEVGDGDGHRADATLLAGAVAAKNKAPGKAWEQCVRKGLRIDPHGRPVPSLTPYFVRPADLLKPAIGAYEKLAGAQSEDPSTWVCEGLLAWFSEDLAGADRHFARVVGIDPTNAEGLAYRALIAVRRRDPGGALRYSARAVESSKASGLAWYSNAIALSATNKMDKAKTSATEANRFGPNLLGAKTIIGEAEAIAKHPEEARRQLTSVLLADPFNAEAKRALYKHAL